MKLLAKTSSKIVIEVTLNEIEKKGFDFIWDKIRDTYSSKKFELYSIELDSLNSKVIHIELVNKKS